MTKNIDINMLCCLDLEHDYAEVVNLHNKMKPFIVKRNSSQEDAEHWVISARCVGTCQKLPEGKNRHIGFSSYMQPNVCKKLGLIFIVFEVIEYKRKVNDQKLSKTEIEVNTWWTNLTERPETVINRKLPVNTHHGKRIYLNFE